MEAIVLGRIQFAANITFHILFPTITISLAWFLMYLLYKHIKTGDSRWMDIYRFWVKIFSLSFALGVVSGVTMSFQFGTNWPGFMEKVGNIAGPLLGYEVLTAFFLEATFLGVMLFAYSRVSPKMHLFSASMVALGTSLSAFWILVLNSWMQTPEGHKVVDGVVYAESWADIIFNPSMPYKLAHMLIASGLTTTFLVAGVSAYQILKGDRSKAVRSTLRIMIFCAAFLSPLQLLIGDLHGLNTFHHQPAKVSAMEGVWHTEKGAPLLLFAYPDEERRENKFEIGIPKMASIILTHEVNGEIIGLNEFKDSEIGHPPVAWVFYSFRVMVAIGTVMLLIAFYSAYRCWRGYSFNRFTLYSLLAMTFSGWIATVAGWYVAEIGRQPWLVYGLLKTEDAASHVSAGSLGMTLSIYILLYLILIAAYVHTVFVMAKRNIRETE